jgi:hypothetical protein
LRVQSVEEIRVGGCEGSLWHVDHLSYMIYDIICTYIHVDVITYIYIYIYMYIYTYIKINIYVYMC